MEGRSLRVMFLTPYFRPYLGGIERAIEQLASEIQRSQRVEAVGVLTTKYAFPRAPQPHWADRETLPGDIGVFRLSGYPKWSVPLYSVPLVWFSPLRIRRYMREFDPDVVHFVGDGWFWGHFWAWVWYRGRARFVFTPSFHALPLSRWWLRPINAFICGVVDRVISLTRLEAGLVRRAYWVRSGKQGVIGWGATPPPDVPSSTGDAADHSSENAAEQDVVTILCVGRLGRHKGQSWLLDVYGEARDRFGPRARLVLVGRDEGDEAEVARQINARGLDGEVSLAGEVSDDELAAWYAASDLLVLFSRYEAFGLVYFEAMVHGVPVLTHDVGSNRELLVRGAEVVARFDRGAAAQALVRLVNDGGRRARLGREAREYALAEFTWAATAERYLREYTASGAETSRLREE